MLKVPGNNKSKLILSQSVISVAFALGWSHPTTPFTAHTTHKAALSAQSCLQAHRTPLPPGQTLQGGFPLSVCAIHSRQSKGVAAVPERSHSSMNVASETPLTVFMPHEDILPAPADVSLPHAHHQGSGTAGNSCWGTSHLAVKPSPLHAGALLRDAAPLCTLVGSQSSPPLLGQCHKQFYSVCKQPQQLMHSMARAVLWLLRNRKVKPIAEEVRIFPHCLS